MVGTTLGHYRIRELLGKGGMGEVYLAEDTRLNRQVALKVLAKHLVGDSDRRQRFEREARAAAALNHPNIVTIHSVEEAEGQPFLTLELIEGTTLTDEIGPAGLPLDRLLSIAIPLTDAVGAAHQRGITHRDLKPANVMLGADGRVKVLDFGLAKLREETAGDALGSMPTQELTGEGRIMGTVAYMSPEQAEGKPVDPRSDVFSLGVMLYEMATGQRPFTGDTQMSVLSAIMKDSPTSVSDLKSDLPRDLARIVKRCLAKDPEDRYQTAKDLRNDLRALKEDLASGEISASGTVRAATSTASGATPMWRQPMVMAAAVVVVAALGYYLATSGSSSGVSTAAVPFSSVSLTRLTTTGTAGMAALSADGRYVAYVVSENRQQSLWLRQVATSSNVQIVPPESAQYDGVSFAPDGDHIYYVYYPAGQNLASLYQVPVLGGGARKVIEDIDTAPAFSPDGRQFAFLRGFPDTQSTAILIVDADGSNPRELTRRQAPEDFGFEGLAWSPDGRYIAAAGVNRETRESSVLLIDAESGAETSLGDHGWRSVTYLAWLPGGHTLLVNAEDDTSEASEQLWAVSYPDGSVSRITNDLSTYSGLSVSADGTAFVSVRNDARSRVWSVPDGAMATAIEITAGAGTDDGVQGLDWMPDGRIVYTALTAGNLDLWVMQADGSNRVQLTTDPASDALPRVTPDGRAIVFVSDRGGTRALWRMQADGSNPRALGSGPVAYWPALSFDGEWVYYSDPTQQNFRIPVSGGTPEPLLAELTAGGRELPPGFHEPTPSPDGSSVAGHYLDPEALGERIAVLSMDPARPERRFPRMPPNARWAPDGRSLIYSDGQNLWRQQLSGGDPVQVTRFTGDRLFNYAVSRDLSRWALVRGQVDSDVVLVSSRRPE